MPGCAAKYCTNSSVKGFKMMRFPQDPQRRAKWIACANRANWVPTNNSTLCEVHFTHDMWEKPRVDGKRKLKPNAIPMIFCDEAGGMQTLILNLGNRSLKDERPVKCDVNIISEVPKLELNLFTKFHLIAIPKDAGSSIENSNDLYPKVRERISDESCSEGTIAEDEKNQVLKNFEASNEGEDDRHKKLEKLWLKSERLRKQMKKKLLVAKKKIKRLECEIQTHKQTDGIRKIFNDDQIKFLMNQYKKLPHWCNATLLKAYQLKFACGTSGYQELLKQKFPLPSVRTLTRKKRE